MNLTGVGGTAFTAYYTGIFSLQQSERAVVSARQGSFSVDSFVTVLRELVRATSDSKEISNLDDKDLEEAYMQHLKEKYGVVRVESVGHDQKSLDRIGGTMMGGTDVVIAPNMLTKMAEDSKKAAEIEGKIDYFFNNIPKYEMEAAAMGLKFQSCGCVVHEDGTVTYICGAEDPPERVAEVNRINREKRAKEAAERKANFEKSQAAANERRRLLEEEQRKLSIADYTRIQTFTGINMFITNNNIL
ncbi:MAG: hypothetical protein IKN85_06195 [Oscillospiraceae bacterium]|nr:hypothetical protein [Oscillospiraceae bacterium]